MTRVLIVDDNIENLYLLRALLQGHHYVVDEARNGVEALSLARRNPPDLIVSDLFMPILDGYTLLRQWKADVQLKGIPFVVYTATYTEPKDERLAMALGADAFLIKPTEPDLFMTRIQTLLAKVERGDISAGAANSFDDALLLKDYNDVLIRKLEKKAAQLEQINRKLLDEIDERKRTESSLRDSEERYRSLFHSIADPMFVYDRETLGYLAVNDAAVEHYGYTRDEFLGMTLKDVRPPEDVPRLLDMLKRSGVGKEKRGIWRHRKKNGEIIEVEISTYGLEFAGRRACVAQARDVTIQRQLELAASRTSDLLRAVADGTPDAVYVKDREGKYLLFNSAAAQIVGKSVEEVLGHDDTSIFGPEEACRIMESDRLAMESKQVQTVEEELSTVNGPRVFHAIKAAYLDGEGRVLGIIGISRDMTNQKASETVLRLRNRAIQAVSQGILITDSSQPDNPIIFANVGFERMTGYGSDEVIGRNCRFLQGAETDPDTVTTMRDAIAAGRPCEVEILNYRKDGTPFWNALSLSPVHDDTGTIAHYVGVQSDITDRRKLADQLRQAQKMEAIGQLAGGVAHDFNNLLTVITGYSELLIKESELNESARESVEAIREASDRAGTLTRQLLGFSRQSLLQPKVLDLNAVVLNTGRMMRRLIGEDIALTTVLDPNLNRVKVDPGQLDQALINLVVNARDAMPRGGKLTIETSNVVLSDDYAATHLDCKAGDYVMLAITDTGCGMSPEVLKRIFEPFFTTKEVGKGTGLGLAMVFGFVQQSNGCIHVYSEVGRGTTFKVYLPAIQDKTPEANTLISTNSDAAGTETILVVEDEEAVRGLAFMSLKTYGYSVLTAADGVDALKIAETHREPIHLVLSDVVMPNLSGPEMVLQLKQRHPTIKVLYMSGYTDDAVVRHGLLEAEVSFIQKPYTPTGLARKVRQVLDQPERPVRH